VVRFGGAMVELRDEGGGWRGDSEVGGGGGACGRW